MNQKEWLKEHKKIVSEERQFLKAGQKEKTSLFNDTIERFLPDGIREKLNVAFIKGFEVVFTKESLLLKKHIIDGRKKKTFRSINLLLKIKKKNQWQDSNKAQIAPVVKIY